ncbi:MAG: hypothetical protein LBM98_01325 [Oscillospiraceae bacterium]|nr:hypothetical protein [Oscillospiraceae bacterium]
MLRRFHWYVSQAYRGFAMTGEGRGYDDGRGYDGGGRFAVVGVTLRARHSAPDTPRQTPRARHPTPHTPRRKPRAARGHLIFDI